MVCRGRDISKFFRESLGIRDNESRLYVYISISLHHEILTDSHILAKFCMSDSIKHVSLFSLQTGFSILHNYESILCNMRQETSK